MIWLARWAVRLSVRLSLRGGLRWVVVAAAARFVVRRLSRGAVERATAELEARAHQRLPAPVARAVSALPPEVRTAGGSAVVAARAARRTLSGGRAVTRAGRSGTAQVLAVRFGVRNRWGELHDGTDEAARQLRARYLRWSDGPDAATDSLLDLRSETGGEPVEPHDVVPGPILRGRRRAHRRPVTRPDRPSRTYRRPARPWD
jgi:hypothetical protein